MGYILDSFINRGFSIQSTAAAACALPHGGGSLSLSVRGFLFVLLWEEQSAVPAIWFQRAAPVHRRSEWSGRLKTFISIWTHTQTHTHTRSHCAFKQQLRKVKVVFYEHCTKVFNFYMQVMSSLNSRGKLFHFCLIFQFHKKNIRQNSPNRGF